MTKIDATSPETQSADLVADNIAQLKALFPELPPSVIPYMFPLLIDHPAPHFYLLKHLGVPIWRWDDMAVSGCANATAYRTRLLHLPCHQGLSEQQMDWMLDTVALVLRSPPSHS